MIDRKKEVEKRGEIGRDRKKSRRVESREERRRLLQGFESILLSKKYRSVVSE